jgi:membrane protease YdiL (CAAX protease family)
VPIDPDILQRALLETGLLFALGVAGLLIWRKRCELRWLAAAVLLHGLYLLLLTRGFGALPNWPAEAQWNWAGKGAAIVVMLGITGLLGWRAAGVTLKQTRGAVWAWAPLALVIGVAAWFAWSGGDGQPSGVETIAFQWTMPSFDEELYYRGVLLLVLDRAFPARARLLGAPIGWGGLLTVILFGSVHGLGVSDGQITFDGVYFAWTAALGAFFLWLRARTGSLLAPVVGHSAGNGLFTLF